MPASPELCEIKGLILNTGGKLTASSIVGDTKNTYWISRLFSFLFSDWSSQHYSWENPVSAPSIPLNAVPFV